MRPRWGIQSPWRIAALLLCLQEVAWAGPTTATIPDDHPRESPGRLPAQTPPEVSDLDGLYLWLGPSVAAGHLEGHWDTTAGAELSILRVREHEGLGAIGGSAGAAKWTERDGGRIWLEAVAGTRICGWMAGVTAGPLLELSDVRHPHLGGSVGVWAFAGITPFARVGYVEELGSYVELGVQFALPVIRR